MLRRIVNRSQPTTLGDGAYRQVMRDLPKLAVGVLRRAAQHVESGIFVDALPLHQEPDRDPDRGAALKRVGTGLVPQISTER